MNVTMDDLHTLPKKMFENYLTKIQKDKWKVNCQRISNCICTFWNFRSLIKELALKRSFKPDIIFIDYLKYLCIFKI